MASVQSHVFIYSGNRAAGTNSLKELDMAEKTIKGSIRTTLSDLFQKVHERRAQIGQVEQTHDSWNEQADKVSGQFLTCQKKFQNQYPFIPLLETPEKVAQAICQIFNMELLSHPLKHTCDELFILSASPLYRAGLSFFKEKVKASESDHDLEALVKETLETIDGVDFQATYKIIVQETSALYDELLRFFHYAAKAKKLDELAETLEAKITNISPRNELSDEVTRLIEQAGKRSLKSVDDFRGGQWLTTIRYSHIQNEIIPLGNIAKALCELQERVEKSILARDVESNYTLLLQGLENALQVQKKNLTEEPFSRKVHAGWNYVARLEAKAREIRTYIRQHRRLKKLTSYAKAIEAFTSYAKEPSINRLIFLIKELCSLEKPHTTETFRGGLQEKLYTVLNDSLAVHGPRTLALSEDEKKVPDLVFREAAVDDFTSYLKKGFLHYLYFSNKENISNEFEVVLYILSEDPVYQKSFEKALEDDAELQTLYAAYKHAPPENIKTLVDILSSMHTAPHSKIPALHYGLAQQRLSELSEGFDWLERPKTRYNETIVRSLYAEDKVAKQKATDEVVQFMQHNPEPDADTRHLLTVWSLNRLIQSPHFVADPEMSLLTSLFTEYLCKKEVRETYRELFQLTFMEGALMKFVELKGDFFPLKNKRGTKHQNAWQEMLTLLQSNGTKKKAEDILTRHDIEAQSSYSDLNTYPDIIRHCFYQIAKIK